METSISIKKKKNKAAILLQNDLSIYQAVTIKEQLQEVLYAYHEIELTLKEVSHLDLTLIQTLISFKNTAASQNKKLTMRWESPNKFAELLVNAGFGDFLEEFGN